MELHQAQGDVLIERIEGEPALDRCNCLLERSLFTLHLGEPRKHLPDASVAGAALCTDPVVEVYCIAQRQSLKETAAIDVCSALKLGNQAAPDLALQPFT